MNKEKCGLKKIYYVYQIIEIKSNYSHFNN